jgi:enoyl-CoA hydratase
MPKPTIAMVRGYCIGGGTAIAVNCDIRIAADDAASACPPASWAWVTVSSASSAWLMSSAPSFTAEIFFTARQFNAQEALQMNLVNRVVPAAELEKYTIDYARRSPATRR